MWPEAIQQMRLYPIEGAMHEVRESQDTAERSLRMIVSVCRARHFADRVSDRAR